MKRIDRLIFKYRYYLYVISILMNVYGCIQLNPVSLFGIGWCAGLLFCQLVNEDII